MGFERKAYKRFRVSTLQHKAWGGNRRWWQVNMYTTQDDFAWDAKHYTPADDPTDWSNSLGGFHPSGKQDGPGVYLGLMRLSLPTLHVEIVAHECAHAAMELYRSTLARPDQDVVLGSSCDSREEELAFMFGDILAQTWQGMMDNGFYMGGDRGAAAG